jgi:hypothetical protein
MSKPINPGTETEPNPRGGWIQTATGGRFYPLHPRPDEINMLDVAHALSNLCRFAGHTYRFYSVAEHSLHVSRRVEQLARESEHEHERADDAVRTLALAALLHDAPEAFVVDLPRPIKHMPGFELYRLAENRIAACVCLRFGLPAGALDHPLVKHADNELLFTERRDLLPPLPEGPALWAQGATGDAAALPDLDLTSGLAPGEAAPLLVARFLRLREGVNIA